MKLILLLVLTIVLTIRWVSANEIRNNTAIIVTRSPSKARFILQLVRQKVKNLWGKFTMVENSDSFIGRCFGVARKLKFAMPIILILLGVIATVLAFLTIFSLKSLGLLGLLVLLNVSGAVSKIAVAFSGKSGHGKESSPQNVHLHVHQTKDGNYELGHTAPGWEDRLGKSGSSGEDLDNPEINNLYRKIYLNNLLLRNYDRVNS